MLTLKKIAAVSALSAAFTSVCFADIRLECPHWYMGGNLGVSHLHDKAAAGSTDYVDQNGPGWNVNVGAQFIRIFAGMFGAELGYTQYADSRENNIGVNVANTEHYSTYLAAEGKYPLVDKVSALGKLGVSYQYARKVFIGSGATKSANTYSPYGAIGLAYDLTCNFAFVGLLARDWGHNNSTGSADLYSLGFSYSIT